MAQKCVGLLVLPCVLYDLVLSFCVLVYVGRCQVHKTYKYTKVSIIDRYVLYRGSLWDMFDCIEYRYTVEMLRVYNSRLVT